MQSKPATCESSQGHEDGVKDAPVASHTYPVLGNAQIKPALKRELLHGPFLPVFWK
jgi:hypothetical protein